MISLSKHKKAPKKSIPNPFKRTSFHDELRAFAKDYPHIFDPNKVMVTAFFRGFCYGAGFLLAMAIAVPIMVFVLRQVEWVPMIGDIVTKVIDSMRDVHG